MNKIIITTLAKIPVNLEREKLLNLSWPSGNIFCINLSAPMEDSTSVSSLPTILAMNIPIIKIIIAANTNGRKEESGLAY